MVGPRTAASQHVVASRHGGNALPHSWSPGQSSACDVQGQKSNCPCQCFQPPLLPNLSPFLDWTCILIDPSKNAHDCQSTQSLLSLPVCLKSIALHQSGASSMSERDPSIVGSSPQNTTAWLQHAPMASDARDRMQLTTLHKLHIIRTISFVGS